jgi:uncharacterized protein
MTSLSRRAIVFACLIAIVTPVWTHRIAIARNSRHAQTPFPRRSYSRSAIYDSPIRGDYDYYVMLGAAPNGGFEARRRMGFAHFDGPDAKGAWFKRRSGAPLFTITTVTVKGDLITVSLENGSKIEAVLKGDTIEGRIYRDGQPIDRIWLVKRKAPITWESSYALWPGEVSQPTFQVTVDPAVPMTARDGTVLMNYVARPVGSGPFGVVLERTPYLRIDKANGEFWASRGYIYVKQDQRGRGGSGGVLDINAMQEQDGYDAVEWAAQLPDSNGKVGMIGGSNPGLNAWYAAIAAPPHLATIAPTVATADPLRIVPYIDMVFSPTIVPWVCFTAVKDRLSDVSNVNDTEAFAHLPVITASESAGCGRPKYWNDWFDHQQDDAYWRALSIERHLDQVKVPVLGIAGWHDDARGTIRNYEIMSRLRDQKGAPLYHVVMDASAHKGIDYVNGYFGPQARIDRRDLQLRWMDHYLKGIDNGVDAGAPLDIFVIGDNTWRKEREWPLARTVWTNFYLRQNGRLETTAPGKEPADEYRYDPANPTPFLVNSRELELSLNEDYRTVDAERKDLVTYTTAPFAKDTEITGPMTATLWAVTSGKDTDWNVMVQHVYPDGRAERIQDGVMRARFRDGFDRPSLLKPGKAYKYDIDLWFTSRVIPAGHRLRVVVASAAFPKYDRNLNTGGDNERDTRYIVVRQRILHDKAHPSFVRLPIIPR